MVAGLGWKLKVVDQSTTPLVLASEMVCHV